MSCVHCGSENCKGQRCPDCTSWQYTHGHNVDGTNCVTKDQQRPFVTGGGTPVTLEVTGIPAYILVTSPLWIMVILFLFGKC